MIHVKYYHEFVSGKEFVFDTFVGVKEHITKQSSIVCGGSDILLAFFNKGVRELRDKLLHNFVFLTHGIKL